MEEGEEVEGATCFECGESVRHEGASAAERSCLWLQEHCRVTGHVDAVKWFGCTVGALARFALERRREGGAGAKPDRGPRGGVSLN
jgi:hypothetical protein